MSATGLRSERARRFVVAYDVVDDRRRDRIARLMTDYGVRVQYSVFECVLEPRQHSELIRRIARRIDAAEDRISIYRLCNRCSGRRRRLGRDLAASPDPNYLIW